MRLSAVNIIGIGEINMRELREIVSEENISDIEFNQYLLSFIWKCMKKEYKVVISTDSGPHISVSRRSSKAKKPYPPKEVMIKVIELCFGKNFKSDHTKLEITKGAFCSHIREIPINEIPAKFLAKRIN